VRTVGLRYLDGFRCIGAECEDDCCTGWAVPVDEPHFHAIEARLGDTAEGKAELQRALIPQPEPNRQRFALMILDERRRCAMLGEDRLCTLHGRFGEEVLPDTCAVFPRSSGVVGGRFELSASLSCPEVARRCLLADGATDPVEMSDDRIVRGLIYKAVRGDEGAYHAAFDAVRTLILGVLSQRQVPVASRLFALAWFADQTRAWLHEQAANVDREALSRLAQLLRQPGAIERFHQQLQSAQLREPFAASVVQQVLVAASDDPAPLFGLLVQGSLARDGDTDPAPLWEAHRARQATLSASTVEKLELALEAFCKNFAFKDWYIKAPSFTRWLHGLLVRVTILRYLVVAHPDTPADPERAIVQVAYSFSRTMEHDDRSMARILDALHTQGMQTLAHAVSLLTF
jgi:lysine-N-methylase